MTTSEALTRIVRDAAQQTPQRSPLRQFIGDNATVFAANTLTVDHHCWAASLMDMQPFELVQMADSAPTRAMVEVDVALSNDRHVLSLGQISEAAV